MQQASREAQPSTLDVVARHSVMLKAAQAVNELAEPYRTTVLLRYLDELSIREISARTHATEAGVRKRLSRGLAKLRSQLGDRGVSGGDLCALLPIGSIPSTATASSFTGATNLGSLAVSTTMTKFVSVGVAAALGNRPLVHQHGFVFPAKIADTAAVAVPKEPEPPPPGATADTLSPTPASGHHGPTRGPVRSTEKGVVVTVVAVSDYDESVIREATVSVDGKNSRVLFTTGGNGSGSIELEWDDPGVTKQIQVSANGFFSKQANIEHANPHCVVRLAPRCSIRDLWTWRPPGVRFWAERGACLPS